MGQSAYVQAVLGIFDIFYYGYFMRKNMGENWRIKDKKDRQLRRKENSCFCAVDSGIGRWTDYLPVVLPTTADEDLDIPDKVKQKSN